MVRRRALHPKPLFDEPSLLAFLDGHDVKAVHRYSIWKHILANPSCPLDEIPGIPERIRKPLRDEFSFLTSKVISTVESAVDGTLKMLVRLQDGGEIEAVLIRHSGDFGGQEAEDAGKRQAGEAGSSQRDTLCISSQVGCRLGCTFCATGTMGLDGNLLAGEILEQLIHARSLRAVSNVVFMGMGEPLENFDGVASAIHAMVDFQTFAIAPSSITVSTVGIVGQMRRFMKTLPKVKLALSLHAPTQELREQIMPVAKTYSIDTLMEVLDEYAEAKGGKRKCNIMVSYILLAGVNDSDECARRLGELLRSRPVLVNLIAYNPFDGNEHGYTTPSRERIDAFWRILVSNELRVIERRHHGRDIAAACGQLANASAANRAGAGDIEGLGAAGVGAGKASTMAKKAETFKLAAAATAVQELALGKNGALWMTTGIISVMIASAVLLRQRAGKARI
eukprot:TRINITY_DN3341_c0_g3_i1.p1 TRINITY_DN3341_c0_g3~~TRINITY_DN3341_c0_g3_i1.p1  ORF type:complete len:451 (+),score=105.33 TRINITY_DN3341_c0_g3_i1:43-1395(+)